MKFKDLIIENFLAIETAKISLADRGLVLIQGVNEDDTSTESNGAGKSSIADAVCWLLFGTTARGETGDDIINLAAGKNCMVMGTIEDGDEGYVICRHRKHKEGKNSLTVRWVKDTDTKDLTKGTDKLTQEVVDKIIGCTYEVFKSSIYAGQEQMPDLPAMTDKQLKVLVEEAAGVTILEAAYEEARARLNAVKTELDLVGRRRDDCSRQVDSAHENATNTKAQLDAWEGQRTLNIENERASAKREAEAAKTFVEDLKKYDLAALVNEIAAIDAKIAAVTVEQTQDRKNSGAVTDAVRNVDSRRRDVEYTTGRIAEVDRDIAKVDHEIGCPCKSCARPMTIAEIEPRRRALTEIREKFAAELVTHDAALKSAQASLASVTDTRDRFRASMTDVSVASAQRASLMTARAAFDALTRDRDQHVGNARRHVARMKELTDQANPYAKILEDLTKKAQGLSDDHLKLIDLVQTKASEVRLAEMVAKVFSPAGVRAHILDDVTPFLNDQTAKYLAALSDGNISATWSTLVKNAKGELREKFSIEVVNATGGKSFGLISGGEKRKVRIAAALALQDLVARRASKPIELFIGDEIDDALDTPGLERLMGVLEEKARERGSVFVISHNSLKDWCSQVLLITKKDGKSTIEEMTT